MSTVRYQAPGYHSITPSITVQNAAAAIDFYKSALGATEVMRLDMPDGKVMHGEIQIGDSRIMLSDEFPDWGCISPQSIGGTAS
jgi:PhnB protein